MSLLVLWNALAVTMQVTSSLAGKKIWVDSFVYSGRWVLSLNLQEHGCERSVRLLQGYT